MNEDADRRPSPDALLAQAAVQSRGKLKIYLGAAPGVGKTFEMLSDARKKHTDGIDIVAGIIETHGRAETRQLCDGLTILPSRKVPYKGRTLEEMDLDALLRRRPAIALIDELAHSNAEGSRHPKRWMDVEELIAAGIDVWTTLNIQHVESLNDVIARITRVRVRETVPDAVIERADEIELIDLTPDQLIERLREGKIYAPDQARRALRHYFAPGNLSALRELAMRRAADRIDVQVRGFRQAQGDTTPWAAGERILVCIDERDSARELVRHTKRLADSARASWIAVHVRTSRDRGISDAEQTRLNEVLRLAALLGAETATLPGDRVAEAVLAYARDENVTQIVVGKTKRLLPWGSVTADLIARAEHIAIHVLPEDAARVARRGPKTALPSSALTLAGLAETGALTMVAIGVAVPLDRWLGVPNLGLVFLAPVLMSALRRGLWPALFAASVSVLAYDFFFTEPRFSFAVYDPQAIVSLIVFTAAAIVVSSLAARARDQTLAARTEARTSRELLGLAHGLAAVAGEDDVARTLAEYSARAFDGECAVFARVGMNGLRLAATAPGTALGPLSLTDADMAAAQWAMDKGAAAGRGTDTLAGGRWLFVPLRTTRLFSGVLAIARPSELSPGERRRLNAMADQGASAMERAHIARAFEEARLEMDADKLRATMFASLSHDLKTPIAGILGSVSSLRAYGARHDPETQAALLAGIETEADRMQRYVVKLLDMTRLDAGGVKARLEAVEVSDIVSSAIARAKQLADGTRVEAEVARDLPMLRADGALLHQALLNLLENAILHGGGTVTARVMMRDGGMVFEVLDEGAGLPPDAGDKVFEKFWRADTARSGGSGLGLPIVRGFAGLMGASVSARDRKDGKGAVFAITFPKSACLP